MYTKLVKKLSKPNNKISLSHTVIMSVLAFVFALGGYGGYVVYQQQGQFGAGFEEKLHVVERVIDGDTLVLDDKSVVRLLLIDTPEIDKCFGDLAKKELERLTLGQKVRIQKDVTAVDNTKRLLRYVFVTTDHPLEDSVFVNEALLRGGFARLMPEPRDKLFQEVLSHSAGVARNKNIGLYANCPDETDVVEQTDPNCNIKGNNSRNQYGKKYFPPYCPNYGIVKMDKSKGDQWFCSEKEAEKAGYSKSQDCI